MSNMITVRITDGRRRRLDALVEQGAYPSRSAVVIEALDRFLAGEERRAVDREIVEGYERIPPTSAEDDDALRSTRESILEERW